MLYRYDFRYAIAKFYFNNALRLNFRDIVFTGRYENVSRHRPVIFAPNHRNALIDALLLVLATYHRKQVVFLARADIFKQGMIAWILKGMRIMPVFRMRDGKDNLERNNEIFHHAARILRRNNPLALFPEGVHNPKQSLLPIRKAVPRIVLPTEASAGFTLNSQIVPVSIYYRDIFAFLSDVYITFGAPIEVSGYRDLYNENPVLAVNALRQELEERLKKMVVNIQSEEYYGEYRHAIDWNGDRLAEELFLRRKDGYLQASLHIVRELDRIREEDLTAFERMITRFREAAGLLTEEGLRSTDRLWKPKSGAQLTARGAALLLTAPLALFGFLNGIFPILIQKKLQTLFKDKQFVASARYAAGLIFVPLFDLLQSLAVRIITSAWLPALTYFLLMPATFYFALYWRKWWKQLQRDRKVQRFATQKPEIWKRLLELIRL
ncbi:MAG: 1-acyl-sn-glycerol-3-phosphate acyltransferase [Proteiniphilum sp.]|nr:1-acyl-sn-glycerol-3-phosphate acyltransferase [Proteiniphilum sp.]